MSHRAEREARDLLQARGYWVVRAAGSMGTIDLVYGKNGDTYLAEVKETGRKNTDGTRVFYMKAAGGKGLEQRDALARVHEDHPSVKPGFLLRAKGHLPEHVDRWTWHAIQDIREETVLRSDEGLPLREAFP